MGCGRAFTGSVILFFFKEKEGNTNGIVVYRKKERKKWIMMNRLLDIYNNKDVYIRLGRVSKEATLWDPRREKTAGLFVHTIVAGDEG